ncbi:anaerobic sulfatase maturase [Vibrio sp. CAU 1672]|uniref:anaerobic sulfatase maturase n=1 Tax=Vibrio sp. CAU 1672 TaxID=3032594 RepID=UPI0023D9E20A|nr:anaerobic sulfatase maturase [Vibrio sp. CAU 1672]MDF2153537.1 anaerobic sulfatase maturase [Vibrio sp. CAU 1672]
MTTQTPLPFSLFIKTEGAKCNLDCSYCYYLNHQQQYDKGMALGTVEKLIKNHIRSQPNTHAPVDFIWHGGEPLLRGLQFYAQAVTYQQQFGQRRPIRNTIQTNGTLINNRWAEFFKKHQFMVGVSVDGPQIHNDIARVDKNGGSSFERTMRGIEHLKKYEVEFNTLTVVNNRTYKHGQAIYRFLKEHGSDYLQFQPCLDHELDRRSQYDWSLNGAQWGEFLCNVFDAWCEEDIGKVYVQFFENCLMILMGQPSQMCHHSATCGQQLMTEANGEVYSCDHFGYPSHKLGNLEDTPLQGMVSSKQQRSFGLEKQTSLCHQCNNCDFLGLCHGGCPKNRTLAAEPGKQLNQLCDGYRLFFRYALPRLLKMVTAMQQGYSPAFYRLF